MKKKELKTQTIQIRITPSLKIEVDRYCYKRDTDITRLITDFLKELINK